MIITQNFKLKINNIKQPTAMLNNLIKKAIITVSLSIIALTVFATV